MLIKSLSSHFKKFSISILILLCSVVLTSLITGCEEKPTELGLNFVPSGDTLKSEVLDSRVDTILITGSNPRKYINTSSSANLMVGLFQSYISKALLKFISVTPDYDSATVLSASLNLRSNDYFFEDSLGVTAFEIFSLTQSFDFTEIKYDELTSSSIGQTVIGTYSGTPTNLTSVSINLDNQTVQGWLNYAADTNHTTKNYGIVMLPAGGSNTIKSFYSSNQVDTVRPSLTVIVSKNSNIDTLTLNVSQSVSLNDAPTSILPQDRFILQSGISFRNIIKYDLTKLPSNVTINMAMIELTLDKANSYITTNSDERLLIGMLTDTVENETDGLGYYAYKKDSITYMTYLNPIFQKWNSGISTNYGLLFANVSEYSNLDRFVFYSHTYADVNRRPRLKIIYTIRN